MEGEFCSVTLAREPIAEAGTMVVGGPRDAEALHLVENARGHLAGGL